MNNKALLTWLMLSSFSIGSAASAETLGVNGYPSIPGDAEISLHNSLPVNVPQPGDAYFDPPSERQPAHVSFDSADAPEGVEAYQQEQSQPIETIDISSMFSEVEDESEALVMRMSADPFENISAKTVEEPQEIQPASGTVPEEIVWSGPRVTPDVAEIGADSETPFWAALEGANMKQVLDAWSRDANVELIWDSQNAFAVLESFNTGGSFEGAVKNLLDQYRDNQVRPVATLHVDPKNGQKTLIVKAFEDG